LEGFAVGDPSREILDAVAERHPAVASSRTLIGGLIAALVVGFAISKVIDLGEIGGLERSNGALKEQVELYKAKLQVGSPEEALKKLQALEEKIDALEPKQQRRLTAEQQSDLASALAPIAKEITPALYIFFEGTPEEARYLGDFVNILKKANINMFGPLIGYANTESDRGIMVGLKNPEHPSDLAVKFIDALRKAGVEPSTTHWRNAESAPGPDFDLFVAGQ
jgi:hypothetical protein